MLDALADDVELALEAADLKVGTTPDDVAFVDDVVFVVLTFRSADDPTKICLKYGSTATADAPTRRSSVGRSRQPSSVCPSSWTISSISASIVARADGSRGRNTQPAPYSPAGGSVMPRLPRLLAEELVRHLDEDAGAVAGVHLAAARAAMQQVDEELQRLLDDGVRAHDP